MAFVHQSEQSLEAKRLHCKIPHAIIYLLRFLPVLTIIPDIKCVKAFESALALLSDP